MPRKNKQTSEAAVREIRRRTRRKFSAEEKIRIVLDGLRGEMSVAELCRREGIAANLYYRWSKDFLEQEPAERRHGARSDQRRSEVASCREQRAQGGCGRGHASEPSAQKNLMGPGDGDGT